MSSTEAEYIAAVEASMEAVWMRKFINGLGGVMPSNKRPIKMLCDNEPALAKANDPGILKGARHFQRKYHFIREVIQEGKIVLKKVHTDDNVADPFTKPVPFNKRVMNGTKPLTLDYKTFVESTGLDYAKGIYVSHPSLEAVKAELAKIIENPIILDRTPVLKTTFPVAWRIHICCLVFLGTIPDAPRYREKHTNLLGTRLPSTLDEGTHKSQPLPKGTTTDPKDSGGNVQPTDKGSPSMASNEGLAKTTPCPKGPLRDKDLEGNKSPADIEPINPTVADPSGTGAGLYQTSSEVDSDLETLQLTTLADIQAYLLSKDELAKESDEDEVFVVGDDMEEDTQANEEEHQSPSPNKDKPEPSHSPETQVSDSDSSSPKPKRFENTLQLIERGYIEGYYGENVNLLNALNGVIDTLKVVQDAVKDDPALNKKVIEATEAYTKNSSALTDLLSLAAIRSDISSLRHDTSEIKSMMTEIYQAFKGENDTQADTDKPPSHTEGEHVSMEDDKGEEENQQEKVT
ncbi:hypothetical protein Tco_1420628 [Tanacetum coccineum]